jgi:prophage tail gpP-like protein
MRAPSFGPLEAVVVSGLPELLTIDITISAEEAVRTAAGNFVITGSGVPVVPGHETTISASGDVVLTGYVRDVNTGYSDGDRTLGCSFVSRTVDLVETSVDHPSGEILNRDMLAIAKELDNAGIGIETDGAAFPIERRHKLIEGESAFSSIARRARGRGILIHDTEKGRLKLSTKPGGIHAGTLKRGVNILPGASASFTESGRYSEIKVRGQQSEGTEKQHLRPETKVKDSGVKRKRVLILPHEGEATIDRMRTRATWQAKRAAGNSVTASIPTTGWRDENGRIWQANWLVYVDDDWLGISGLMVIKSVTLSQHGDDKTFATLSLADPRSLGGENPRGKTSDGYAAPGEIEAEYGDE